MYNKRLLHPNEISGRGEKCEARTDADADDGHHAKGQFIDALFTYFLPHPGDYDDKHDALINANATSDCHAFRHHRASTITYLGLPADCGGFHPEIMLMRLGKVRSGLDLFQQALGLREVCFEKKLLIR